ncbi:ARM repeat-containing protein [Trametes coccinea BRFM310]|uniref:ARM repeat-containing protein n=1 Tax=Trametes coccinea (strain BRFM310) TaxID=1353009 RepID=A0A1Y2IGF8_TRAC3|nr:ARM repeat-containing protein [Trametes coccinea BRFM310]
MGSLSSTQSHYPNYAGLECNEFLAAETAHTAMISAEPECDPRSDRVVDIVLDATEDTEDKRAFSPFVLATPAFTTPGSLKISHGPHDARIQTSGDKSTREDDELSTRTVDEVLNLLSRLTSSTSIYTADSLLRLVNESEEEDGLVLWAISKCTCHATSQRDKLAEPLASLSSTLVERLADLVLHDERFKDRDGIPLKGGPLFRSHLLRCCEAAFSIRLAAHGVRRSVTEGEEEADYEADIARAKRQDPGLLKFIGELFNAGLLVDRVIHSCLTTLFGDAALPNVKCMEDAYVLLKVSGRNLDTPQARHAVDSYFSRIEKRISEKPKGTWRIRTMLEELVKLRQDGWASEPDRRASIPSPQDEPYSRNTWRLNTTRTADEVETWRIPAGADVAQTRTANCHSEAV